MNTITQLNDPAMRYVNDFCEGKGILLNLYFDLHVKLNAKITECHHNEIFFSRYKAGHIEQLRKFTRKEFDEDINLRSAIEQCQLDADALWLFFLFWSDCLCDMLHTLRNRGIDQWRKMYFFLKRHQEELASITIKSKATGKGNSATIDHPILLKHLKLELDVDSMTDEEKKQLNTEIVQIVEIKDHPITLRQASAAFADAMKKLLLRESKYKRRAGAELSNVEKELIMNAITFCGFSKSDDLLDLRNYAQLMKNSNYFGIPRGQIYVLPNK